MLRTSNKNTTKQQSNGKQENAETHVQATTDEKSEINQTRNESEGKADAKRSIEDLRTRFLTQFGQVTLTLMGVPRYGHQSVSDLQRFVIEPLIRDRIAIATSKSSEETGEKSPSEQGALAGIAIWASVSDEVDAKIQDQIKSGMFPIRLSGEEWRSGDRVWLLDVIAPSQRLATGVLAHFNQVVKGGEVRLHPIIGKMIDPENLKKMGARRIGDTTDAEDVTAVGADAAASATDAAPADTANSPTSNGLDTSVTTH